MAKRRLRPVTVYFEPAQLEALTKLSRLTRVPKAVYVREAIDRLLKGRDCGGNSDLHPALYGDVGQNCPSCQAKGRKR